ncbi:MAG: hypothetical protein IJU72_09315 [Bacteroidales bacterium]|nr:hypothetical protein [Bacteroidales bacterium]
MNMGRKVNIAAILLVLQVAPMLMWAQGPLWRQPRYEAASAVPRALLQPFGVDTMRISFDALSGTRMVRYVLVDVANNQPVGLAHVVNLNKRVGVVSSMKGQLVIPVSFGDSLYISALGYEPVRLLAFGLHTGDTVGHRIALQPKAYEIEAVEVVSLGPYSRFLKSVVRLNLPYTEQEKLQRRLLEYAKNAKPDKRAPLPTAGPPTDGGAGIAMNFGLDWTAKQNIKVTKARKREREQDAIYQKFNPEKVQQLTGLSGDSLLRFINHISLADEYLLETPEYEICVRILDSLRTFRAAPLAAPSSSGGQP